MESTLVDFLLDAASTVKKIEDKAKQAIKKENDSRLYIDLMKQKAEYLVSLLEKAESALAKEANLDERKRVKSKLESFSKNASTALDLNSTFYMSALLYPDEHKEGEPNNLELLAQSLQK